MHEGPDRRDSRTWVVIELNHAGEMKLEEGSLEQLLREALQVEPSFPIFIPSLTYLSGGRRTTIHLMQGYVFVSSGLPENRYIALEGVCPYVRKVLTSRSGFGMRALSVVSDESVRDMREALAQSVASDITEGMRVLVTEGTYAHLDGLVLDVREVDAAVRFTLRSLDVITTIPRMFLTPMNQEES